MDQLKLKLKLSKNSLQIWFMALRPKTLPAGASPVFIGLAFAYHHDPKLEHFSYLVASLTLICTLLMQMAANLINDYFDAVSKIDNKNRLGPVRATQQKLLPPQDVKRVGLIFLGLAFCIGIGLLLAGRGGLPVFALGIISIIAAYSYTGGPYPLSHYALGEVFAFIFFGPVAVIGTYLLQLPIPNNQNFSQLTNLMSVARHSAVPGLLSAAIMAINNFRDQANDLAQKKYTLPALLGPRFGRIFILLLLLSPLWCLWLWDGLFNTILFLVALHLPLFKNILFAPISKRWNNYLAQTGRYLLLYAIIMVVSLCNF